MKSLGLIIDVRMDLSLVVIDIPDNLKDLKKRANLMVGFNEKFLQKYTLKKVRFFKKKLNVWFDEIKTEEQGKQLVEKNLYIQESDMIFENDEGYFISDLVDCEVFNIDNDELIGKITDVYILPANDVWIVETTAGELPVPVIVDVVKEVDVKKKKVKIVLLDGLMELLEIKNEE